MKICLVGPGRSGKPALELVVIRAGVDLGALLGGRGEVAGAEHLQQRGADAVCAASFEALFEASFEACPSSSIPR